MDGSPDIGKSRKASFDTFQPTEKLEKDYGFNFETNIKLTESNPEVSSIWKWLNFCKSSSLPPEGLLQILEKSESSTKLQSSYSTYQSEERTKALKIIEWDLFNIKSLESKLIDSKDCKNRKAMFCIFSFENYLALKETEESCILIPVLQNYQETDQNYAKMCKSLAKTENDLWVKSSLLFLSGPKNIGKILESFNILDSCGFALRFLNDQDLKQHLKALQVKGQETGDLQALIISGFTVDSPILLQKYYEKTGDIQTVGILSIFTQQYAKFDLLDHYVHTYKNHLARIDMFYTKCQFEIEESRILGKKQDRGKGMRCYYCGNSVANCDVLANSSMTKRIDSQSHDQAVLNHCPSCPGALPRCCVCLTSLKAINPYFINKSGKEISVGLYTWCEKCHHGGHNSHILEWFNDNLACPVYGCGCHCASID